MNGNPLSDRESMSECVMSVVNTTISDMVDTRHRQQTPGCSETEPVRMSEAAPPAGWGCRHSHFYPGPVGSGRTVLM